MDGDWESWLDTIASVFELAASRDLSPDVWDSASHTEAVSWVRLLGSMADMLSAGSSPRMTSAEVQAHAERAGIPLGSIAHWADAPLVLDAVLLSNPAVKASRQLMATVVEPWKDPAARWHAVSAWIDVLDAQRALAHIHTQLDHRE